MCLSVVPDVPRSFRTATLTDVTLIVIFRRLLQFRARHRVMLNPELRFFLLNEALDHLSALCGLLLVEIETRHDLQLHFFRIVIEITRKKNRSTFCEF